MTSNFQKCEDDPTIMTSEEEKFSVNDRDGVAVPNNLEEGYAYRVSYTYLKTLRQDYLELDNHLLLILKVPV